MKADASEQETVLAEKQSAATKALEMITSTMQNANLQRGEMEQLRHKTMQENEILEQKYVENAYNFKSMTRVYQNS